MAKEKTLVEDTFIQMKNLEEAVAENAKGILASTMKQEIKDLVKESLFEQEEEEDEVEMDADVEDSDMEFDADVDNVEDDEDLSMGDDEFSMDDEEMGDEEPIDLTGDDVTDEEVLKVFQLMGPEDEVIVTKNNDGNINLKDSTTMKEYMIVQESETDEFNEEFEMDEEEFGIDGEFEMDEEEFGMDEKEALDGALAQVFNEMDDSVYEFGEMENDNETIYELEMEDYDLEEDLYESKSFKAKGVGMGTPNKFKYSSKPNQEGAFKVVKKSPNKTMGTGKAKFEYKEGENLDGEFKIKPKKKVEANEASRTYANGSKSGRGLRKGITPNRNLNLESVDGELNLLREKNNEYRNALNIFRDKLNEVAVFNSNLAYATRLCTEHTTTKQEKINILKRFDSVETIKESKNLYQSIKQELNKDNSSKPINESIERSIDNSPSTGSAINLIESKTYENPQFLRMRDLMGKIK